MIHQVEDQRPLGMGSVGGRLDGELVEHPGDFEDPPDLRARICEYELPAGQMRPEDRAQPGRVHEDERAQLEHDRGARRRLVEALRELRRRSRVELSCHLELPPIPVRVGIEP